MSSNCNDVEVPAKANLLDNKESSAEAETGSENMPVSTVDNVAMALTGPKHPLAHTWTLWYYENDRNKDWEENQREVTSFSTVEDFWSVYTHVKAASDLKQGCDYALFKQGIRPMWEDKHNKRGGRWLINLEKKQRNHDLDKIWMETLLALIGESFEYPEDICGAVVNVRSKGDKIGLWTGNAQDEQSVLSIGNTFKERLKISSRISIGYQIHKDTAAKAGSVTKNSFIL